MINPLQKISKINEQLLLSNPDRRFLIFVYLNNNGRIDKILIPVYQIVCIEVKYLRMDDGWEGEVIIFGNNVPMIPNKDNLLDKILNWLKSDIKDDLIIKC